jgi:U5 small nuclear ribonucleoprotein component
MYFNGWRLVSGDPLNDSIVLKPLEPSPKEFLARDLVLKTRRRKGLPESIETTNIVDQDLLKDLVKGNV